MINNFDNSNFDHSWPEQGAPEKKRKWEFSTVSSLPKRKVTVGCSNSTVEKISPHFIPTSEFPATEEFFPKERLLSLSPTYRLIESHTVKLLSGENYVEARLYPSEKVISIFKDFDKASRDLTNLDKKSPFSEFIKKHPLHKELTIEEDTTLYVKEKQIDQQIVTSIQSNSLVRSGGFKWKYNTDYMFVIDQDGRLLIQEKKTKAQHGRLHHSSLSRGRAVRAAGMMSLADDKTIVFTNLSGHYKPKPESLAEVIAWFNRENASINNIDDKIETHPKTTLPYRKLTIKLE